MTESQKRRAELFKSLPGAPHSGKRREGRRGPRAYTISDAERRRRSERMRQTMTDRHAGQHV